MGGPGVVDLVDHSSQRRGLAAARLAGDQDQALVQVGELQHFGGQVQLFQSRNFVGQQTDGGGKAALLTEQVHPDPAAHHGPGQVHLPHRFQLLQLTARQLGGGPVTVVLGQGPALPLGDQPAHHPEIRGQALDKMYVRGPQLVGLADDLLHIHLNITHHIPRSCPVSAPPLW